MVLIQGGVVRASHYCQIFQDHGNAFLLISVVFNILLCGICHLQVFIACYLFECCRSNICEKDDIVVTPVSASKQIWCQGQELSVITNEALPITYLSC